jgi:hypothetical protein
MAKLTSEPVLAAQCRSNRRLVDFGKGQPHCRALAARHQHPAQATMALRAM